MFRGDQDTAGSRRGPGRPPKVDRRKALIEKYGEERVKSMDGECGHPFETLSDSECVEAYAFVAKERGWK